MLLAFTTITAALALGIAASPAPQEPAPPAQQEQTSHLQERGDPACGIFFDEHLGDAHFTNIVKGECHSFKQRDEAPDDGSKHTIRFYSPKECAPSCDLFE